MAFDPVIAIKALWDGTKLKSGTDESEAAVESLADSVEASSDQMRASLASIDDGVNTTLSSGGTFSSGVDDVEAEGGRLKEVGSEVGAEFAANLQEGVASGDIKGTLLDTFSGLGAAAGATGQLGLAAAGVGVLLGATLMKGLAAKAQAERQEFVDAVNTAFEQIEVTAQSSFETIRREIKKTFTETAVIAELGGEEGVLGGYERINELIQITGVKFNDVVDILQGEVSPRLDRARELIIEASDNTELWGRWTTIIGQGYSDNAKTAQDILKITEGNVKEQDALLGLTLQYRDGMTVSAAAAERSADAWERISRATDNVVRNATGLGGNATGGALAGL